VTAFAPGSPGGMPRAGPAPPGGVCAADWLAQGPGDAAGGAKGLSQEKALAAGLEAGNLVRPTEREQGTGQGEGCGQRR